MERILATHTELTGCGEVHNFQLDFQIKERCSCQKSVDQCPFWGPVYLDDSPLDQWSIFEKLAHAHPDRGQFFIDSSKTSWKTMGRPWKLHKRYDVYVLHLIRNGESCLYSNLNRKASDDAKPARLFKSLTMGIHWTMANLSASLFGRLYPERYHLLHYESLIAKPAQSVRGIFKWLQLNPTEVVELLQSEQDIPLAHQLSGNRIRHQQGLRLKTPPPRPLEDIYAERWCFRLAAWPILKAFGY